MRNPTISTDAELGFATNRPILHGAVLVGALLAFTLPASAATLKVDNRPGCSDLTGDPYCTISAAITAAVAGDKIKVKGKGLPYDENIVIPVGLTGLKLRGKSHPIIDGGGSGMVVSIEADGVTFKGFEVTNGEEGIVLNGVKDVTIEDNMVFLRGVFLRHDLH